MLCAFTCLDLSRKAAAIDTKSTALSHTIDYEQNKVVEHLRNRGRSEKGGPKPEAKGAQLIDLIFSLHG
eukprot:152231-Amphidinium_carterae.1